MRIIILGLNFYPEIVGIGRYTGEMAQYLFERGHTVRVITAPPYYPEWRIWPTYSESFYRFEKFQGMDLIRCPIWVPRKPTGINRLLHLFSFATTSAIILLRQNQWRPDVILCVTPTFFCTPVALLSAFFFNSKSWLHIQDFELDAALNLGLLPKRNYITKNAFRLESWILRHFDMVSTISNSMHSQLIKKGVAQEKSILFPNWVDINTIYPLGDTINILKTEFEIPTDKLVILYSGNMGRKQGLEIIIEAAKELCRQENIIFVMCGDGAARFDIEKSAQNLHNVKFIPLQPNEKLNQLLNLADIHILPQKPDVANLVMPSKLQGMLASGKPVLGTADIDSELFDILSQVGRVVSPGDLGALCTEIVNLADNPKLRKNLGEKGRMFACTHWSREDILLDFEARLRDLVFFS